MTAPPAAASVSLMRLSPAFLALADNRALRYPIGVGFAVNGKGERMSEPVDEDAYANNYWYFRRSLGVLSQDAEEQCQAMDFFNVARELKDDVLGNGHAVLNTAGTQLSAQQEERIRQLLENVADIPDAVVNTVVNIPNSRESHRLAMSDPCWVPLRAQAKQLIDILSAETDRVYAVLGMTRS